MIKCEMTYRQEVYDTDYEGDYKYEIMTEYDKNDGEGITITIRRMARVGYGHWEQLCNLGWGFKLNEETNGGAKFFKSVEEAFGYINNIVLDDITIGTPVHISTGSDRDNQEWDGIVVTNDRYNDDYPYKVEIAGKDSYGVFSKEEVSKIL